MHCLHTVDEKTRKLTKHKDRRGIKVYIKYQSVCPFFRIGFPHPSPLKRVRLPYGAKGRKSNTPLWVTRGTSSDDWKEGLALCILCDKDEFSM